MIFSVQTRCAWRNSFSLRSFHSHLNDANYRHRVYLHRRNIACAGRWSHFYADRKVVCVSFEHYVMTSRHQHILMQSGISTIVIANRTNSGKPTQRLRSMCVGTSHTYDVLYRTSYMFMLSMLLQDVSIAKNGKWINRYCMTFGISFD